MIGPLNHADVWHHYAEAMRPPPPLSVSEFARAHRVLHANYCVESPGPWNEEKFPHQHHTMNMVQEAIETGKRGVVWMAGGQVGKSDTAINGMLWLKVYYPGPQLFMTATDETAEEFGRERFEKIIPDCEPLARSYLKSKHTKILLKRFADGNIRLVGGQSIFKLLSTPYRHVVIDELDSLTENLGGEGDPVKIAEVRMDSYSGYTLMIAYAHPTTIDRGAGKIYYESSDQRRPFVKHDCGAEFISSGLTCNAAATPRTPTLTTMFARVAPRSSTTPSAWTCCAGSNTEAFCRRSKPNARRGSARSSASYFRRTRQSARLPND